MASPALLMNGNLPKNVLNGAGSTGVGVPGSNPGGNAGSMSMDGPSGAITPVKTIAGNALSVNVPMKSSLSTSNLANSPSSVGSGSGSGGGGSSGGGGTSKRLDVDSIMVEFQKLLGDNWDRYQDVITNFLVGRLTRFELQEELDQILDKTTIKLHNHFLLTNLANSLRDPPPGEHGSLSGWFKKHKEGSRNVKGDSQLAKLKEDILGLSVRERKRIKAIARVSGPRETKKPSKCGYI